MKRLAILLGQSQYSQMPKIQACENDLISIKNLVESTASFDDILIIDDSIKTATDAKEKIRIFLELNATEPIDELFFYFTGHGCFIGHDFIYLWNDFDPEKHTQTSLLNSEIDLMITRVSPKLLVKVVDACYAESSISISPNFPDGYGNTSKKLFDRFYGLLSCQKNQYSLADSTHSFFTSLFLQAVNRPLGTRIRYRDIISYISEAFEIVGRQTPIFVAHADFTEQFCIVTKRVAEFLSHIDFKQQKQVLSKLSKSDLFARVQSDAAQYVTLDEAQQCLLCGLEAMKELELDIELSKFFEKDIQITSTYSNIPKICQIAEVIADSSDEIYAQILYDTERYTINMPVEYTVFGQPNAVKGISTRMLPFVKSRNLPKGFVNSFDLPYVAMFLTLKSKFANLMSQTFIVVPVLSRTQFYYFYTTAIYKRVDWDRQVIETSAVRWGNEIFKFDCYQIKIQLTKLIQEKFLRNILDDMKIRFGVL